LKPVKQASTLLIQRSNLTDTWVLQSQIHRRLLLSSCYGIEVMPIIPS